MTMAMVHVLVPSCVCSSEANAPVCRISKRLASHVQPVEAGEEEGESAERVEAKERGGQHHVEGRLDQEAGEAGEEAEEGQDAEEGDGGPGGD